MNNEKKTNDVQATHSLVLWTGINYSGPPLQASNGQAGILAADTNVWDYKSVGISSMQLYVWSAVDTATPGYSFNKHIESLLSTNQSNLPTHYPAAEFPLQYIGINPLEVGVLLVNVNSGDHPVALALSQTYPGSGVPLTTFAAPGINGALGFFSLVANSSTQVSVQYGDFSTADGSVDWSGNGSLEIVWNGTTPTVGALSGLPNGWRFGTPAKQSDDSWLLTLSADIATNVGMLYTGKNFTGSSKVLLPHTLIQLNSGIGWTYNSLELSAMSALIYSAFAPTNKNYVYTGYNEQLLNSNVTDFSTTFAGSAPVSLLSLESTDVVVYAAIITRNTDDNAWIITQSYPQAFYTFASSRQAGVLAILPASGSAQLIPLTYGSLNDSGHFTEAGTATLNVSLENGVPVITSGSDWPSNLIFSAPQQQSDGNWTIAIADAPVAPGPALYPQINYGGTPLILSEHQSVELRTLANLWKYDSLRVFGHHWLSSTLFNPQDGTYDYRQYRDNYSDIDVPDISKDYPLTSPLINGTVLGPNDVVVRVKLQPGSGENAVMSASQSWPRGGYTAATYIANVAQEGVLIIFDKTQPLLTIPVRIGLLGADGTAVWTTNTTVTARWDNNLAKPVLVLGKDAPSDYQLSALQPSDRAGEFTVTLAYEDRLTIAIYATTNAPCGFDLDADESFASNNKLAFYPSHTTSVQAQLNGHTSGRQIKFRTSGVAEIDVDLPALQWTVLDFYSDYSGIEKCDVIVTHESIAIFSTVVNFTEMEDTDYDDITLAINSGAPANGLIENSIYLDSYSSFQPKHLRITLTGSAVFAGTTLNDKIFDFHLPQYDFKVDIVNTVAEIVNITLQPEGSETISTTSTFVPL